MHRSTSRRIGIVLALVLPTLLLALNAAYGQPGMRPNPGMPAMPRMPAPQPNPMPVVPNIPAPHVPVQPNMPSHIPQQPNVRIPVPQGPIGPHGQPQGGIPGQNTITIMVWTCSRCGKELGTGAPPNLTVCPYCGVRISGFANASGLPPVNTNNSSGGFLFGVVFFLMILGVGAIGLVGLIVLVITLAWPKSSRQPANANWQSNRPIAPLALDPTTDQPWQAPQEPLDVFPVPAEVLAQDAAAVDNPFNFKA